MIDYLAPGICTARAWARVDALLAYTRAILVARCTDNALRSAVRCAPNVSGQTRADSVTVYGAALAVLTAWRWITRVNGFGLF